MIEQSRPKRKPRKSANNKYPLRVLLFNKPMNVLSQFTSSEGDRTLKQYIPIPNVYPAGRLDKDSEGLLLLTNDGRLQAQISEPKYAKTKVYYVLVEGQPTENALQMLRQGVYLKDGMTRPAEVSVVDTPSWLWERDPPVRVRKHIKDTWLRITLHEGKNRQIRRMTAHVGYPTLRIIRTHIGDWSLEGLQPGEFLEIEL